MQRKKPTKLTLILTLLLLVSLAVIGIQAVKIKELRAKFFSLIPGEELPDLDLITLENKPLEPSIFEERCVILFTFGVPCASCNPNLSSWKSLAQYFGDQVTVVGIIRDGDPAAFQSLEEKGVNFQLYLPWDKEAFSRKMRLKSNLAITIVVYKSKVQAVKVGTLTPSDLKALISTVKSLIKST